MKKTGFMNDDGTIPQEKAKCIYDTDEVGNPIGGKHADKSGKRYVGVSGSSLFKLGDKHSENISIGATTCMDGTLLPGHLILPAAHKATANFPEELPAQIVFTENGFQTTETFIENIRQIVKFHKDEKRPFPLLLLTDGHTSRISLEVLEFCRQNMVELFAFPPHTTHLYQMNDRLFNKWHVSYEHEVDKLRLLPTFTGTPTRDHFLDIFTRTWYSWISVEDIINAYKAVGFSCDGLNPHAIADKEFIRSSTFNHLPVCQSSNINIVDFSSDFDLSSDDPRHEQDLTCQPEQLSHEALLEEIKILTQENTSLRQRHRRIKVKTRLLMSRPPLHVRFHDARIEAKPLKAVRGTIHKRWGPLTGPDLFKRLTKVEKKKKKKDQQKALVQEKQDLVLRTLSQLNYTRSPRTVTIAEMKCFASTHNITLKSGAKKDEIIETLKSLIQTQPLGAWTAAPISSSVADTLESSETSSDSESQRDDDYDDNDDDHIDEVAAIFRVDNNDASFAVHPVECG